MSQHRRNILVGTTVIGALLILGWMTLKFGGKMALVFAEPQIPIQFIASRADGIAEGSPLYYRGVSVGQVSGVRRHENQEDIIIDALVDQTPPLLPGNLAGEIKSQGLIGGASGIDLVLTGPLSQKSLAADQVLKAEFIGLDLLPPEFADLAKELREVKLIKHLDETIVSMRLQLEKAGAVMDSLQQVVGDARIREDLQVAMKNIRGATETAGRVGTNLEKFTGKLEGISDDAAAAVKQTRSTLTKTEAHVDDLAKQMGDRLHQLGGLLENFQSISGKLDKGQGTAGLLINDPKLYESLVDTSRELNLTISDLKRLVEQWEQEGVSFKLSK